MFFFQWGQAGISELHKPEKFFVFFFLLYLSFAQIWKVLFQAALKSSQHVIINSKERLSYEIQL